MIILRDKLFSETRKDEISKIIEPCHTYIKEIIKSLELYWKDPDDVNHWIDKAGGFIYNDTYNKQFIKPHYCFIYCFNDNDIINLIGRDSLYRIRSTFSTSERFIESVKKEILTEKGGKYKIWLKTFNDFDISNKEYIKIFHFISLCMSGIILPSDWYSNHWNNLSIPKNSNIKLTSVDQLKELIHECLKSILGVGNY